MSTVCTDSLTVTAQQAQAEQFNGNIPWMTTKAELEELQSNGPHDKPTLVLISKQWCGACKRLKQLFNSGSSEAKEVEKLAQEFNMMSLADDQEPASDEWAPDGGYVPRMYFLDKEGKMIDQYNKQVRELN